MKIGDLFLALGIDTAAFKPAVEKAAGEAGTAGGKKLSSTMSLALKAGSVIVGGAFALMTKGAMQMEEAQGKFQAATGRSRDEAIAFSKDMNGLVGTAKTVGVSFDEITATGIAVSQQFDITGQKATDLTDDILGFAKVTGQDASDAAGQLEDTLSAFGLTTDDAAGFMDKLVFSSQKYGTDAGPAMLGILQSMAPALQAMGLNMDDSVALMNLFEVAGVKAGDAQRGLNSAITNLPPGTTMNEFLQHLIDLKNQGIDPTAEAVKVFGNKAGAGIALAIQPGMTSLQDFAVTGEETAGTVDKAAEDMLTTSGKFKIFAEKIGGFLREGGQAFGPLLTGLASLGTLAAPFAKLGLNMASKLKDMFVGLLRNVGILGAATALGAAEGEAQAVGATGPGIIRSWLTKFGLLTPAKVVAAIAVGTEVGAAEGEAQAKGAMGAAATGGAGAASAAGLGLGSLFGIGIVAAASIPVLDWLDHQFGQTPAQAAANAQAAVQPMGDALGAWAADMKSKGLDAWGKPIGTAVGTGAGEAVLPALASGVEGSGYNEYMQSLGSRIPEAIGTGVKSGAAAYQDSLNVTLLNGLRATHMAAAAEARALGAGIPGEIGQGIYDASGVATFTSALAALRSALENGLTPEASAMAAIADKAIEDFKAGLRSQIPGAKETAQQVGLAAVNAIEDAGVDGTSKGGRKGIKAMGQYYDELLGSGLTKGSAAAALEAAGVSSAVIAALDAAHEAGLKGEDAVAAYNASIAGGAGTYRKNSNYSGSFFGVHLGTAAGAAGSVRGAVVTALSDTSGFAGYGSSTTGEYASGIDSPAAKKKATDAAHRVLDAVRAVFYTNSPPRDPILHDIGKWGTATIAEYAKGLLGGLGMVQGASSTVAASLTSLNGLSAAAGGLSVGAGSAAGRSMSVDTVNVYVTGVDGDPAQIGKGAADAFIWNLEHAMSAVTSG